jgi:hypothetical protein
MMDEMGMLPTRGMASSPRPKPRPLEMNPTTGKQESAADTQKRLDMSSKYKRGGKAEKV